MDQFLRPNPQKRRTTFPRRLEAGPRPESDDEVRHGEIHQGDAFGVYMPPIPPCSHIFSGGGAWQSLLLVTPESSAALDGVLQYAVSMQLCYCDDPLPIWD
jgi:hypothetical protein